ncbi:hypothetical protein OE88DRAFT_1699141 [Heliocybe sulcata]|uniref:UvrD-like helicase ATP-binding domain-containing protein n=1 Tax=Heliocybe sulcata TaxID=5364 RepID=A0A5C3N463_9AGAM|nr:hypothetical protein OE88DRAFT_1699141 [Heliocybe sulcata]
MAARFATGDSAFMEPDCWKSPRIWDTIDQLERGIWMNQGSFERYITQLLSQPSVLQLFISAASEDLFSFLNRKLQESFTDKPARFAESLQSKLLSHLSLSLLFLKYPPDFDVPSNLSECRRSVELSKPVLEALPTLVFGDAVGPDPDEDEDDLAFVIKTKQKSQRQKKRSKKGGKSTNDETVFRNLGVDAPTTPQDAEHLGQDIMKDQKGLLAYYLTILRRPGLAEHLQKLYNEQLDPAGVADSSYASEAGNTDDVANTSEEAPAPSAYPIVQPMKAALYFESAEGLGDWHIFISTRADRDLREARRKDLKTFKIIVKKIQELSRGHFSDDNQKRLTGPNLDIPIYEAKMTRDLRLVYQIDCLAEFDSDIERQVIKVFGVYTHAQMDNRLWEYVGHQLACKGKEYKRRCTFRNKPVHTGDNVISPASFPPQTEETDKSAQVVPRIPGQYLQEIHSLLVLEKFVTLSQALLNSILADRDVAHVFAVSPQEREIIEHPLSCYVLGRSGTGKTTTMLFKMLGIQRSWEHGSHSVSKPRQVFVTSSRILATKVEEYFSKLIKSLALSTEEPKKLIQAASGEPAINEDDLMDPEDDPEWRVDLPKRFSLLEDDHFPLFITFEHLCQLLEGDLDCSASFFTSTFAKDTIPTNDDNFAIAHSTSDRIVSYDKFRQSYWTHLPQGLTKGLDPALVFNEIMGVIKGSEQSLTCTSRCLDRQTYNAVSHRAQSTFASQRDLIYSIFESYQKLRRQTQEIDSVDRTHALLMRLAEGSIVVGRRIDFLYVDEVQDNHLIDAYLLRSICKNPNGLFWAGDTAQTISVGSSFKFNDLKAFLYRLEQTSNAHSSYSPPRQPRMFQLTVNYRSHAGIVKCAHSVVELITKFWPYAIDALNEERGIVEGLRPIFFGSSDSDTVRYEQFLFGESKARIEFGARQCILVRNEAARDELRGQVGDIGLIMTLYESKGLEFDDVLLYKFFTDSTSDLSQWRVVLNAVSRQHAMRTSVPAFDEIRHAGICSELKFLYVAITRARNNLWIFDPSERAEPMQLFWRSEGLVDIYTPEMELPQLAVVSTQEEWSKAGRTLFDNRRYFQAMHCFERADMPQEYAIANAFHLRERAKANAGEPSVRARSFKEAADAFAAVGNAASRANLKRRYMRHAADCFVEAGDDRSAGQAFYDAEEFDRAAHQYHKAGLFDEAVEVVRGREVDLRLKDKVVRTARLFYIQKKKLRKAAELFGSVDEQLDFMEEFGFDDARADVLESMKRFAEAGEVHLMEGRISDGMRALLKDQSSVLSVQRAKECLVDCFWRAFAFGRDPSPEDTVHPPLNQLLEWTNQIEGVGGACESDDELHMFKAMGSQDIARLRKMALLLCNRDRKAAALLCFSRIFVAQARPLLPNTSLEQAIDVLRHFHAYVELLRQVGEQESPWSSITIRKLFGFEVEAGDHAIILPKGTFFFKTAPQKKIRLLAPRDQGLRLSEAEFTELYRQSVTKYILSLVLQENECCLEVKALRPCVVIAMFGSGRCSAGDSCPRDHSEILDTAGHCYNLRAAVHLQQIQILHAIQHYLSPEERERRQRTWVHRLYDTLNPPHSALGSLASLDLQRVPEASRGLAVLKFWLANHLYSPSLYTLPDEFIMNFALTACLGFMLYREQAYDNMVRAPSVQSFVNRGSVLSLAPLDLCLFLLSKTDNSLSKGITFLRYGAEMNVQIDLNLLCGLMESLCGSLIICRNFQNGNKRTLHGVALPRSWLLRLIPVLEDMQHKATGGVWPLIDAMASLVKAVLFPGPRSHLHLEGRSISHHSRQVRNVFVVRTFWCMCLLGYNVYDPRLRDRIREHITSFAKSGYKFPLICDRFIRATKWEDLARAVRRPLNTMPAVQSYPDLLILLHDAKRERPSRSTVPGVHRVIYSNIEDIRHLLLISSSSSKPAPLRANAEVFKPKIAEEREEKENSAAVPGDGGNAVDADEIHDEVAPDKVEEALEMNPGEVAAAPREIRAATVIQTAFRRIRDQRRNRAATIIQGAARRFRRRQHALKASAYTPIGRTWNLCLEVAGANDWPSKLYRAMFLGPFVHALICLESLYSYASSGKDKAKKKLRHAQHQELDEAMNRTTNFSYVFKRVVELQKLLQPKSSLHAAADVSKLVKHVSDIKTILGYIRDERMPGGGIESCEKDARLAYKGIVQPKAPPKRKPLPELVMDDEYGFAEEI